MNWGQFGSRALCAWRPFCATLVLRREASPLSRGFGRDPECGLLSSGTRPIAFGGADASLWHQTGLPGNTGDKGGRPCFSCYCPSGHGAGRPLFLGKSVYSTLGTLFFLNQQRVPGPVFLASLCVPGPKTRAVLWKDVTVAA